MDGQARGSLLPTVSSSVSELAPGECRNNATHTVQETKLWRFSPLRGVTLYNCRWCFSLWHYKDSVPGIRYEGWPQED